MNKLLFSLIIFLITSGITLFFQKQIALKGENISIKRSTTENYGILPDIIHNSFPKYKHFH